MRNGLWKAVGGMILMGLGQAWAAQFQYPVETGDGSVTVGPERPVKNLYVAGATVVVRTPVKGDLIAAGGRLHVEGPVEKDLTAVAGELDLKYPVGDDARLAGGALELEAALGGDLIAGGGKIHTHAKGKVGGDAALAGGEIWLEGPVRGRAWIAGGTVRLNAPIGGAVVVRYDKALELGPQCRVGGKLECYGPVPPTVDKAAKAPGIVFHPQATPDSAGASFSRFAGLFALLGLVRFFAWLLAAWLLTVLIPKPLRAILGVLETHPARDLGLGFVILLAAAVGIPFILLTGVGYYIALAAGSLLALGWLLSRLLAAFYLGILLWRWIGGKKDPGTSVPFRWVVLGLLVLHAMGLVPVVGWLVVLILTLIALGGAARLVAQWIQLENLGLESKK